MLNVIKFTTKSYLILGDKPKGSDFSIETINFLSHKSDNNSCSTFKLDLAYSLIGSVLDFSDKTSDFVSPYTEQVEEKIYFLPQIF